METGKFLTKTCPSVQCSTEAVLSITPQDTPQHLTSQAGSCRKNINRTKRDHVPWRGVTVVSSTCPSSHEWCCCTRTHSLGIWTPVEKDGACKGALCSPYTQMCTQSQWNPLEALEAQQLSSGPSWAAGGHKFIMIYQNISLKNTLPFSPQNCLVVSNLQFYHAIHKGCPSQPSSSTAEEWSEFISFAVLARILDSSFNVYGEKDREFFPWGSQPDTWEVHVIKCWRGFQFFKS